MASRFGGLVRLQSLSSVLQARSRDLATGRASVIARGHRQLHISAAVCKKIDFLLADVGEGIAEVEVLNW
jgi:hypothetical protein